MSKKFSNKSSLGSIVVSKQTREDKIFPLVLIRNLKSEILLKKISKLLKTHENMLNQVEVANIDNTEKIPFEFYANVLIQIGNEAKPLGIGKFNFDMLSKLDSYSILYELYTDKGVSRTITKESLFNPEVLNPEISGEVSEDLNINYSVDIQDDLIGLVPTATLMQDAEGQFEAGPDKTDRLEFVNEVSTLTDQDNLGIGTKKVESVKSELSWG